MTIDKELLLKIAKETGFVHCHLLEAPFLEPFADRLEAEIRKEFEDEARIQNETIANQHTEIKALELAIDLLPSVAYVNGLTAQNAKLMEALENEGARLDFLLCKLQGDAIRYVVGELSDTSNEIEFREAIDAAMTPQPEKEGKE